VPTNRTKQSAARSNGQRKTDVDAALTMLKRRSSKRVRDGMARYAIPSDNAIGVSVSDIKKVAKGIGRDHDLAESLWTTGVYEARMLAAFIGEPDRLTPAGMQRWAEDFDNWAIVDTVCFALFDRSPHGWGKTAQWAKRREEFVKRAAFALLWSLTVHDKEAADEKFMKGLVLIERAADDERNFVKKAVNMALRAIGKRSSRLNAAAVAVSQRLSGSPSKTAQWVGRDALKELTSAKVTQRLADRR